MIPPPLLPIPQHAKLIRSLAAANFINGLAFALIKTGESAAEAEIAMLRFKNALLDSSLKIIFYNSSLKIK